MSNSTINLEAIACSKLFKTSSRRNEIYVKAASIANSSSALKLQPDYMVDTSDDFNENEKDQVKVADIQTSKSSMPDSGYASNNCDLETHEPKLGSSDFNSRDSQSNSINDSKHSSSDVDESSMELGSDDMDVDVESCESVVAASGTSLPRTDVTDNINLEADDIKGFLNSDSSTCGVSRVHKVNDELWVRYQDSINLNDVMVPAIELLNRPGYTYLQFNRLARSENSIVFVILNDDTEREKKPESEIKEQVTKEQ